MVNVIALPGELIMSITGQNVTLRDLVPEDLDDYRRWFFTEAEWQK
jgi:hypothetical protein